LNGKEKTEGMSGAPETAPEVSSLEESPDPRVDRGLARCSTAKSTTKTGQKAQANPGWESASFVVTCHKGRHDSRASLHRKPEPVAGDGWPAVRGIWSHSTLISSIKEGKSQQVTPGHVRVEKGGMTEGRIQKMPWMMETMCVENGE